MCCDSCIRYNLTPAESVRYHRRSAQNHARQARRIADQAAERTTKAQRWMRWTVVLLLVVLVLLWSALG